LFQDISVTLRQVVPFVFGKDGQEEDRHGRVVVVVDNPHTTTFPTGPHAPAAFTNPACAHHHDTVFGMTSNERDEVLPFRI